jgi:chromosome segregation ATPase
MALTALQTAKKELDELAARLKERDVLIRMHQERFTEANEAKEAACSELSKERVRFEAAVAHYRGEYASAWFGMGLLEQQLEQTSSELGRVQVEREFENQQWRCVECGVGLLLLLRACSS